MRWELGEEAKKSVPYSPGLVSSLRKAILVSAGVLVTALVFYPGCFSGDAQFSWNEAVSSGDLKFRDWHPPLIAFIWHLLNTLPLQPVPRYANLFLAMVCLFWIGVVLAAEPWEGSRIRWLIFCACVGLYPPVLAILSQTIKDSLLCSALVAAYGGLVVAEQRRSWPAYVFGLVCLFLGLGFRYNAIFAVIPLGIWAGFVLCEQIVPRALRLRLLSTARKGLVGLAITAGLAVGALALSKALTNNPSYTIQAIYTFDLLGMSVKTGKIYLPALFDDYSKPQWWPVKGSDIAASPLTLDNLAQLYSPITNLGIYWYGPGKGLRVTDDPAEVEELKLAWLNAIRDNFLVYLRVRLDVFLTLLGVHANPLGPYYCMWEQGQPPADIFYRPLPQLYMRLRDSIFFKGWFYLLTLFLSLLVLVRNRSASARRLAFLACSGIGYGVSYFVIAPSADFRYLYWLMVVFILIATSLGLSAFDSARCIWTEWLTRSNRAITTGHGEALCAREP
jgi:hypothetical protein